MGGLGSGRYWRWDEKSTTDSMRNVDIRRWAREELLVQGHTFGWQWSRDGKRVASINVDVKAGAVQLRYRARQAGEDWQDMNYAVRLLSQPCHLGGMRRWFECPAKGCGKRVAILYGGKVFACRHCHQLVYASQSEEPFDRLLRRANKIRIELGGESGAAQFIAPRPKGMWRRTYQRKRREIRRCEAQANRQFARKHAHLLGKGDLASFFDEW